MTTEEYPEIKECPYGEELVNDDCVDICIVRAPCGENAICRNINATIYCQCNRGFSGNPLVSCFKHDEKSPCDPDPCGPNSICVSENETIGPHCKCKEKFFDFPPNCRPGCDGHDDCADDEMCDKSKNECRKICNSTQCGENARCRHDKKKLQSYCSCIDGFIPERGLGCREKTPDDFDIPIDFIKEVVNDPCEDECGSNAFCGSDGKCECTQGYEGDPHDKCELIKTPTTFDACNPNPCGPYSICKIIDGKSSCSCVDESFGIAPYCRPCPMASCTAEQLCISGKCIENICAPFCGENTGCNVFNDTLECFCGSPIQNENPFQMCSEAIHIPPNVIATLLG